MTKLKVLAVTALASTAVGVGALTSAPSASAAPASMKALLCEGLGKESSEASDAAEYWRANWGEGGRIIGQMLDAKASRLFTLWKNMGCMSL